MVVPVGHTRFSWLPCRDTGTLTVPQSHTRYSWISQHAQSSALVHPGLAGEMTAFAEPGADNRAAHCTVTATRAASERRRRGRHTSRGSETNVRLLDPAAAKDAADNAIVRRRRAPDPWPMPLQPTSQLQRIIIGLGTGRCGTQSLTELLSAQPDCWAEHEMVVKGSMLEWEARMLAGQRCESSNVHGCLLRVTIIAFARRTNAQCDAKLQAERLTRRQIGGCCV